MHLPMNITINQQTVELPPNATVADAVAHWQAQPPFAVAVNCRVRAQITVRARHALAEGDRLEVIAPVTGG